MVMVIVPITLATFDRSFSGLLRSHQFVLQITGTLLSVNVNETLYDIDHNRLNMIFPLTLDFCKKINCC